MNSKTLALALSIPLVSVLSACGGGSGGGGPDIKVEGPQISDIEPDRIHLSDLLYDFSDRSRLRVPITCRPSGLCSVNVEGEIFELDLNELEDSDSSETVYNTLGEWDETVAAVVYERFDGDTARYAIAYGKTYPNSLPSIGSATWRGDMVGLDANNREVRGGAEITVTDFTNPAADVTLTPSARAAMYWNGLPISGGRFSQRRFANDYIRGEFYGRSAGEAGGVFERDGVVGAFGAKRE